MGVISRKKQSNSGKKEKKVRRTPKWNVDSMLGSLAVNYDASVALISGILIAFGIVMVFILTLPALSFRAPVREGFSAAPFVASRVACKFFNRLAVPFDQGGR